jgi:hypothetical protein
MGQSSVRVLACLILACSWLVACKPLYGDKPDKLKNPERKKKPEEPPEAVVQIKYVEDCTASFRDDPKNVRPDTPKANQLVGDGEAALAQLTKAKDPASQAELIKVAIDKYRSALIKDPYNHEATLKLAIAYDMVYRKGCALALLKRINALEANPKYAAKAKRVADEVADNQQWFKGYRKDAVAAVGR